MAAKHGGDVVKRLTAAGSKAKVGELLTEALGLVKSGHVLDKMALIKMAREQQEKKNWGEGVAQQFGQLLAAIGAAGKMPQPPAVVPAVDAEEGKKGREWGEMTAQEKMDMLGVDRDSFLQALVMTTPADLHRAVTNMSSRMLQDEQRKCLELFIAEHFCYHVKIARRLSEDDIKTIVWLRDLYYGEAVDHEQPLPYAKEPSNFWGHLRQIEETLLGIREVWGMEKPTIMYGLMKYDAAEEYLAKGKPGCFLFRLSNSSPNKVVLTIKDKRGKLVQQKLTAYKDLKSFKQGLDDHKEVLQFLYDPVKQESVPVAEVIEKLNPGHKAVVNKAFRVMARNQGYGVVIADDSETDSD